MALRPVSKLCGAEVVDAAGEKLGTIVELMLDGEGGAIVYAVMSYGGTLGVGEKLFAVAWERLTPVEEKFSLAIDRGKLDAAPGIDKDAWPTRPDALFG